MGFASYPKTRPPFTFEGFKLEGGEGGEGGVTRAKAGGRVHPSSGTVTGAGEVQTWTGLVLKSVASALRWLADLMAPAPVH